MFGFWTSNVVSSEIFTPENVFLIAAAILWMIVASVQDFRRREVENWWNFSFIFFVLAFRAFVSIDKSNYWFFLWGLIGLAAGFIIHNAFYYARMFAGGDAKLLFALCAALPLGLSWKANLELFLVFIALFLIVGAVYGLVYTLILMIIYFKKFRGEFFKLFRKYKKICVAVLLIGFLGFLTFAFLKIYLGMALMALVFFSPLLLLYAKAVEASCMIKLTSVKELTVGDLLAENIKIGNKIIRPNWEGLSEGELREIQKKYKKKVLVKSGIPFVPVFLIAFVILVWFYKI